AVPHLGVAHLALGQAHRGAARLELRVRVARPQLVEAGCAGERDGIAGTGLGQPPAVEDDQARALDRQRARPVRQGHPGREATIAANEAASRLAPPTSAPSTSGSARSSAALSGLTLPP